MLKKLLGLLAVCLIGNVWAQDMMEKPEEGWHLRMAENTLSGTGVDKAYEELLMGKKAQAVIVAVLDGGIDIEHEDLAPHIWTNEGELANNGLDDDGNGYVDDVHGWSFIGGPGGDVNQDNLEFTRIYKELRQKFGGQDPKSIKGPDKKDYQRYLAMDEEYKRRLAKSEEEWTEFSQVLSFYEISRTAVINTLGKEDFSLDELRDMEAGNEFMSAVKEFMIYSLENDLEFELEKGREQFEGALKYAYNLDFDPRYMVGDNYSDLTERYYGNNHVEGPAADHGTHVAGIIAAVRGNELGMDGICENVIIMPVRVVPNGDERDKDVANAIRYAVDNGAQIINMSFGKSYSPHKHLVDEAVDYAASKGVLLIHAAGNSSDNIDKKANFPNAKGLKGQDHWIEVGAMNAWEAPYFVADFSNYGRKSVDLFAPGQDIYSTMPNNDYRYQSGTSMAAPVVAGVAALIKAYFPELTAKQIRELLIKSGSSYGKTECFVPGGDRPARFGKLSKTGKVVNAYEAVRLASEMTAK